MRVVVAGIPRPGIQVDLGLGDAWVREAAEAAFEGPVDAVEGDLDVQVRARRVQVRGRVAARATGSCDRCGDPVERRVEADISLGYLPEDNGRFDAELELGADDLDVGWYRDGELHLGDVVREGLALAMPSRIICTDTAGCDARTEALLQRERSEATGHPAFAALRSLK